MKTKLQIIEETVAYYGEDVTRRATEGSAYSSACRYETYDGRHCAVGRCLEIIPEECIQRGPDHNPCSPFANSLFINYEGLFKFKEEYAGHESGDFWHDLQQLHDRPVFWDFVNGGLSKDGEGYVKQLKEDYK